MGRRLAAASALLALGCSTTPNIDLGPKPSGVSVDATMVYYDVNAATLAEIRTDMRRQGPRLQGRTWAAVTRWRYAWRWQYDDRGIACEIRNVRVQLRATIEFPRWRPTAEPDSATLNWWQAMNTGLAEHERGHAQLAMKTAGEIVRRLEGLRGGPCDALGMQANTVARNLLDQANRQQEEYDRRTQHGATQIQAVRRLREP